MTLLDEAIGSVSGGFVLIEDCVETSAGFVLHHLIKRALDEDNGDGCLILLAFANPFSHYDRILRKLVCFLYLMFLLVTDIFIYTIFFLVKCDWMMRVSMTF